MPSRSECHYRLFVAAGDAGMRVMPMTCSNGAGATVGVRGAGAVVVFAAIGGVGTRSTTFGVGAAGGVGVPRGSVTGVMPWMCSVTTGTGSNSIGAVGRGNSVVFAGVGSGVVAIGVIVGVNSMVLAGAGGGIVTTCDVAEVQFSLARVGGFGAGGVTGIGVISTISCGGTGGRGFGIGENTIGARSSDTGLMAGAVGFSTFSMRALMMRRPFSAGANDGSNS
jgi:hypothetical protein